MPGNQPLDMGYVGEKAKAYLSCRSDASRQDARKAGGQEGANAEQRVYCKRQNLHEMREQVFGWDKIKIPHREWRARRDAVFSFASAGGRMRSAVSGAETTFPSQMQ